MQRIRPAVKRLSEEIGIAHALASQRLFTDGVEVIYDYATSEHDVRLTVVRTGQQQFKEIIAEYLECITYGSDGIASSLKLSLFEHTDVVVDPRRGFGMPVLAHHSVRVEDLVDRFRAGDGILEIADDFRVNPREIEDVIRVALAA